MANPALIGLILDTPIRTNPVVSHVGVVALQLVEETAAMVFDKGFLRPVPAGEDGADVGAHSNGRWLSCPDTYRPSVLSKGDFLLPAFGIAKRQCSSELSLKLYSWLIPKCLNAHVFSTGISGRTAYRKLILADPPVHCVAG